MLTVEMQIKNAAKNISNEIISDIKIYSKGAYSQVYTARYEKNGTDVVIKVYLKIGFMKKELRQLEELRKFSIVPIPQVYGYFYGDGELTTDIYFMEYMPGVPVRFVVLDNEANRQRVADEVVDAHLALHNTVNPNGFGELDCDTFLQNWETLFYNRINSYFQYLNTLKDNPLSVKAQVLINEAFYNFKNVFTQPVKEARLIHGDYKMKNLLIDPNTLKLTAMLDPMDCCYGDRESDLFTYTNPHKDAKFGFLENYTSKVRLSDKFLLKNQYYFLWNELKLFILMGYCFNDTFEQLGQNISDMIKYGW
ncbi:MAG: phosphotransferase [Eubacteriales bacterium]|nr:phosphotransferase [Eubacteriales bacterium]MDD4475649.1 phosphotransferase [Eubacteriales bacterium]